LSRAAIIQGLLVSLIIHRHYSSQSWFTIPGSELPAYGYLVVILLGLILILLDYLLGPVPDEVLERHRTNITFEMNDVRRGDLARTFVLNVALILCWLVITAIGQGVYFSPKDVLSTLISLVLGESSVLQYGESVWRDIGVSLLETALGILLGGALATAASLLSHNRPTIKFMLLRLVGIPYVITITLPGLVFNYTHVYFGVWLTIAIVALISDLFFY